jgi:hypothetical protein
MYPCLSKDSLLVFFPLKGDKRYRIVGTFPQEFSKDESEILYEEIEDRIKHDAKLELDIHDVEWFSTYKVHTRHVSRFSQGRCFLAGDAAHIHSPAGAQGMNTGIQDGYNLAWKMASVLQGHSGDGLLETYHEERIEIARKLLQTTDRMFQFVAGSDWFLTFLRLNVLPLAAKYILDLKTVKDFVFPLLSQIGINYRYSSLSQHAGDEVFDVKAGDRMPYFLVDGTSIYDRLKQPRFHFLAFSANDLQPESDLVDFHRIALNPQIEAIFGTDKPFSLLLRPDNYIAFISEEVSPDHSEQFGTLYNSPGRSFRTKFEFVKF